MNIEAKAFTDRLRAAIDLDHLKHWVSQRCSHAPELLPYLELECPHTPLPSGEAQEDLAILLNKPRDTILDLMATALVAGRVVRSCIDLEASLTVGLTTWMWSLQPLVRLVAVQRQDLYGVAPLLRAAALSREVEAFDSRIPRHAALSLLLCTHIEMESAAVIPAPDRLLVGLSVSFCRTGIQEMIRDHEGVGSAITMWEEIRDIVLHRRWTTRGQAMRLSPDPIE